MSKLSLVTTPSEKKTKIVKVYLDEDRTNYVLKLNTEINNAYEEYIDLHLVEEESEIVVDDIIYESLYKTVFKLQKFYQSSLIPYGGLQIPKKHCSKVIASTNEQLEIINLPEHLIEGYCNNQNIIINNCNVSVFDSSIMNINWEYLGTVDTVVDNYLQLILDNCDKSKISSVTFCANSFEVEYILPNDDKDWVTFHKGAIPGIVNELLVNKVRSTVKPIYKDWYMSINYHA